MHTSPSTSIFAQSTTLRVGEPPYAHLTTRPPAHAPRRPFSTLRPQRPLDRWTSVGRHPCVVCRHVDRADIRTNRLVGSITIRRVRPPSSRFVWVKRTTLALPVWGESHQIVLLARCRVRSFRLDRYITLKYTVQIHHAGRVLRPTSVQPATHCRVHVLYCPVGCVSQSLAQLAREPKLFSDPHCARPQMHTRWGSRRRTSGMCTTVRRRSRAGGSS